MGKIGFNQVPENWRLPVVMAEFDNSQAIQGASIMPYRMLAIGSRSGGTAPDLLPQRVTSAAFAAELFGAGSVIADMVAVMLTNDSVNELWAAGLADDDSGVAATGSLTFAGVATAAQSMPFYVGGVRVRIGVRIGDAADDIAAALVAAINEAFLPVTAESVGPTLTLTARAKGEVGNKIDCRIAYQDDDSLPGGITVSNAVPLPGSPTFLWRMAAAAAACASYYGSIDPARPFNTLPLIGTDAPRKDGMGVRLSGGSGNPEIAPLLAALGDQSYQIIATAYTDAINLTDLKAELADRWGPLRMIEGLAFAAVAGTHGQLCDFGEQHNSPHLCLVHTGGPFSNQESNLLLFNGLSALSSDDDGVVRVKKLITTYRKSASGAVDESYLSINTPLTLGYLRWDWRNRMLRKYPRHKLAGDGTRGANIMTPKKGAVECLGWFDDMEELGLVEDRAAFKKLLVVERDSRNVNRLNFLIPPDLVNGFDIAAGLFQFRL